MLASSNETTGLTTDTERKLVASNTPAKCEYVCKPGYVYNSLLKKCELPTYQCIGTIPANAVLIPGDDQGLTANTPRKLVASNTSAKCEYLCAEGFKYEKGKCVAKEWRCTKFEQTYENNGYGAADTYCRQNAPQYFA